MKLKLLSELYKVSMLVGVCWIVSLYATNPLFAQPSSSGFVLDRIVAEVEDKVVLQSDITNTILDMQRQNVEVPHDPQCTILKQLMINKLLAGQAKRDSLTVTDQEIENTIDLRIRSFIQMYGSLENLEKVAGRTVFQIKQDFKEQIRDNKLASLMQQKIVQNVKVTPSEVQAYYNSIALDSLPYYESEIEVGNISIYPKSSPDLDRFIQSELQQYRSQILGGKVSFDFIVSTYSQDPAKVQNNGVYQVNINDKNWDPNFLSACFRLKQDEISLPIKSKFGYHLIKMIERRGTDATVQHVLRLSIPSEIEIEETKKKLQTIKEDIQNGKISFSAAVVKYSEDELAQFSGGFLALQDGSTLISYDQVDPTMIDIIKSMKAGDLSDPQTYTTRQGMTAYRIIYLKTQTQPHQESLKYDYKKINDRLTQKQREEALDKWIESHIARMNWYVADQYTSCPVIRDWHRSPSQISTQ